jgi:hypothetical protein
MKTNEKPNINNYNGTSRLSKFYYENLSLSEEIKNSNKDGISNLKNNPTSMEYSG